MFISLIACFAVLCISPASHGQATGNFSGAVLDTSGGAISGATVTATSQGTGVARQTKTDDAGHYLFPLLPIGIYTVRVEFQGFRPGETRDLRLQVDEAREVDFTLSPSTVSSQIEVSAAAVAVETTNPSLGQVITSEQVTQLPLNGRDFVQLATLTPGTTQETNNNSFFNGAPSSEVSARGSFSLSVGGSRPNSTDWLLDGNDNNELTAGGIAILSSIDSIQEFKVLTYNYSAEYGTRGGPTVLVTTKSGSNDFHGALFEFLRNTSLDAKSFFAILPEKFNLNQFGGSIGGPIRKNKTFFFVDGEQKYQRKGITFTGLVPSVDERTGDFSKDPFGNVIGPPTRDAQNPNNWDLPSGAIYNPNMGALNGAGASSDPSAAANIYFQCDANGNPTTLNANGSQLPGTMCYKIPSGLINPIAKQMINLFPLPTPGLANNGAYNFVNEPIRELNETKFDIRLDHNFTVSDSVFARFSYDQAFSAVPGGANPPSFAEANPFGSSQGIINHGRNIALSETHIFSPTTVNQVSGGYNRIFDYITSQGNRSCQSQIFQIPGANLNCNASNDCVAPFISCGLTSTQFSGGYWSLGDRGFAPFIGGTNVYSINDTLDLIRGKHDIKVGMGIRANQMNVQTEGFQDGYWIITGLWTNNPVSDFLLGLPSLAIHDQTFGGTTTGRRWKIFRPFVQDDWRITSSLTLNLGFAWNFTTPTSEVANRQANLVYPTLNFLISGQGADKWAGVQLDKRAVEPRIGLAWKPFGKDNTAIRAGYAIYHDSSWNQGAQGLWQNPPYYAESDAFAFGGACTFTTAACHTVYGVPLPFGSTISLSDGFATFNTPPQPDSFTGTVIYQNPNFKLGTVQQFNINVERQLPGQIVLTAGYAGSRSDHILFYGNNLNVSTPLACGTAGYTRGCGPGGTFVPEPYNNTAFQFSTIANATDEGNAHYNGLQIKAETKGSHYGVYALVSYTYSRTYDNGLTDGLGSSIGATYYPLRGWQKLDWALSQINLNNNFTASIIYDLPFGKGKHFGHDWSGPANAILGNWQFTLIEKVTSGFPVFVVNSFNATGVNFQNNGNSFNRPDLVGDPNKGGPMGGSTKCPAQVHTVDNWFNPCAFAFPAAGELGNASRTPVNGPGFVNSDFSAIKQFILPWEHVGLNFRVEFFNLFNHPQFALPVPGSGYADIASGSGFGAVSSTVNNPRVLQFGLKLTF
ncbi:MAG TPA: carboxypeptidase-like regulatory domain-containing protein [Candidatus Acidoferrum sp.]|nr:carboxypeptidase-like regulatory domain-containing protein [Candidatus Acidoferrum sp.]